jgi:ATP-dependent Lon protease
MSEKDLISAIDDDSVIDDSSGVPVLPLRDVVVYPHKKTADLDDPQPSDLYEVGTLATILQLLKLPDGTVKVLVEGGERALIDRFNVEDHFSAEITPLAEDDRHDEREIDVLVRSVISQFEQYVKLNKKVPPEVLTSLSGIDEPGRLADTVAARCSASSKARSMYCRSRNVSAGASSSRWKKASASTT